MCLKYRLCEIDADDANFVQGCLLLLWCFRRSPAWHIAMPSGGGIHSIGNGRLRIFECEQRILQWFCATGGYQRLWEFLEAFELAPVRRQASDTESLKNLRLSS
jgi:hypothetical protein